MLDNTSKWSHARGNTVVPSRWQATPTKHASILGLARPVKGGVEDDLA